MSEAGSRLLGLDSRLGLRLNLRSGLGLLNRLNLLNRLGDRSHFRRYGNLEALHLRHLPGELFHHGAYARDVSIGPAFLADLVDDGNRRPLADHYDVVPAPVHERRAGEPPVRKAISLLFSCELIFISPVWSIVPSGSPNRNLVMSSVSMTSGFS